MATATLDWSQSPAVESIPAKRGGAWVFKDTWMPVSTVFENLESGAGIEEIMEWFDDGGYGSVDAKRSCNPPEKPEKLAT